MRKWIAMWTTWWKSEKVRRYIEVNIKSEKAASGSTKWQLDQQYCGKRSRQKQRARWGLYRSLHDELAFAQSDVTGKMSIRNRLRVQGWLRATHEPSFRPRRPKYSLDGPVKGWRVADDLFFKWGCSVHEPEGVVWCSGVEPCPPVCEPCLISVRSASPSCPSTLQPSSSEAEAWTIFGPKIITFSFLIKIFGAYQITPAFCFMRTQLHVVHFLFQKARTDGSLVSVVLFVRLRDCRTLSKPRYPGIV